MEGDMWCRVMVVMMVVARVTQAFPRQPVVDYSGWQVLEVEVSEVGSGEQPKVQLQDLDDTFNLQFLHQDRRRGVAEVALSPAFLTDFTQYLNNNNVKSTIIIDDLGKKLKSDIPFLRAESDLMGAVTFDRFMKYEEILEYLKELPRQYPDRVRLEEVGHSVESRPIHLLVISSDVHSSSTANKPVILIDGGIHAREWVSPAAVLYIVEQLLQSPAMTSDVEWRTLPLLNPDGYIYTWTKDRLWRKNRATTSEIGCVGVDLNRNFGFHFGESGTSPKPCSTVYHGPVAFSEPESQALRDTLQQESSRTKAYVTFHSYGQFVLHPWGYTDKVSKNNINELVSTVSVCTVCVYCLCVYCLCVLSLCTTLALPQDDLNNLKHNTNRRLHFQVNASVLEPDPDLNLGR
ncbi:carboxypeptidase B-like [Homarus americanus]|uniref:carboxypeptidase B-like n=1 Tax=Homarus americanus TaxID=6706 RepID=UPI001C457DF4|nr:carboxypeptidase B-like [Homarus americanus]